MSARHAFVLIACLLPVAGAADPLPSGSTFLGEDLQARQADPTVNPGMLWVDAGSALWTEPAGGSQKSCADCHGDAKDSMRGVAPRYPAVDEASGDLLNLERRINRCRTRHQQAEPFAYETDELLGLTAFVAHQSRGLPMKVAIDGPAAPFYEQGKTFFHERQGQMDLACSQCHDEHAGERFRGDVISHGLGNGYPAYRIEWQTLGSLHRRLRACSLGVRAVRFDYGSDEYLALELYLAKRADGVPIETPAIRK
ncbi:MAG: sulfur oxidation c-type cytochrome SoxA [Alphaproteobacteria bacterium]